MNRRIAPARAAHIDGTSTAALPGALFAVTAPGAVREAALAIAAQFDVGRDSTGSVDVRRLPGDGVEMLLTTPAAGPFDIASHWPGVTFFSERWQDDSGTCLLVRVRPGDNARDLPFGVIERPLAGYPGVVGQGSPTFRTYRYVLEGHTRLVMHTDGVRANWSPAKYPGLFERHPALIASVLFRDCWRQSDDALLFVIDVGLRAHAALANMPG